MSPESPRPNKACQCVPKSAFHCVEGIVYYEYVPEGQKWINITVLKFWSDWVSPFVERGQRNRNIACGLCKRTKHPTTYLNLISFFFFFGWVGGKSCHACGSGNILLPDMAPCDFWLFPPTLYSTKRKEIRRHWHHQIEHDEAPDDYSKRLILRMFPTMTETLASMYGFRKWLFWRGLTIYCCKQYTFFTESVSELVDHTLNGISNFS